jgi:hypothetical protein
MSADEEQLHNIIPKIQDLVRQKWQSFPDFRLLIITSTEWLRVYNTQMDLHTEFVELAFIRKLKPERGQILDFFSKVESLVRELIKAKFLGLFSEQSNEFDGLLQKLDFAGGIELLLAWGTIDGHLKDNINRITGVRNQLAHSWSEKEVFYGKDDKGNRVPLIKNIIKFREDAEHVWVSLVKIYMKSEVKYLHRLISKLEDRNTFDAWTEISKEREFRMRTQDQE